MAISFIARLSTVLGSLVLFPIVFLLIGLLINFGQVPVIVTGIAFVISLAVSYIPVRYIMLKAPVLQLVTIGVFAVCFTKVVVFDKGQVFGRISFGSDPILSAVVILLLVAGYYYITGVMFEKTEEQT